MTRSHHEKNCPKLWRSRRAIAIPVTFLMLFVSMTLLISTTYYFAVSRISAKGQTLKVSAAEQDMLSLEQLVKFVAWSPGTYQTHEFDDFGGKFRVIPNAKTLILNLTDGSFYDVFFNSSVGKAVYELPPSEVSSSDIFLCGDRRVIVNQSSSSMTQLCIAQATEFYEVMLSYRPLAGSTVAESGNGKPVNNLRVYVINLNSSQSMTQMGSFRLKITCVNVVSTWRNYNFTSPITSISVIADLDGTNGEVSLPISSNSQGAVVNLETVTCYIQIEKGER